MINNHFESITQKVGTASAPRKTNEGPPKALPKNRPAPVRDEGGLKRGLLTFSDALSKEVVAGAQEVVHAKAAAALVEDED